MMAYFWLSIFLILVSSAYLYHRLPWIPSIPMASTITDKIHGYCTAPRSVTSEFVENPTKDPGKISNELYGGNHPATSALPSPIERKPASPEELARARSCGNWGSAEPSELFLRCFHDALCALEHDALAGMVSPSLIGSTGTIPLSVIAPLPDIARHMSNLIVRAEREVFLATNFWIKSDASRLITDALLELSKRAGARNQRIVVKVMYDRGNIKQFMDNHQMMSVKEYTGPMVELPHPDDIPHIDMEVQNFHRPLLGTFHAKYMVVDRQIAVVQSNNIQDNCNLEMMTHLEGPIVDSLYDTALLSWEKAFKPALPCLSSPAIQTGFSTFNDALFKAMFDQQHLTTQGGNGQVDGNGQLNGNDQVSGNGRVEGDGQEHVNKNDVVAQNGNENGVLPMHAPGDPHYDPNIAAEIRRLTSNLTPSSGMPLIEPVNRHLNLSMKQHTAANVPTASSVAFTPLIPHAPHAAFPIALVNRAPYGAPNNSSLTVPQNLAWLSAIRNAQRDVFIQTPNLNAVPLLPALLDAVRRGVEVTYYVCLGYNDSGELLPGQGGVNEMVASQLHESLSKPEDAEAKKLLKIHYYVAKDQTEPIHDQFKKRSCHIKLLIADGQVGIQGNGNQDTQSWCHSMEVNVMIDSKRICEDWREGIERNQNTALYGLADPDDGIWRNPTTGKEVDGAVGKDPGKFSWAKGIVGAVQRVRGAKPSK